MSFKVFRISKQAYLKLKVKREILCVPQQSQAMGIFTLTDTVVHIPVFNSRVVLLLCILVMFLKQ